MASMNKPGTGSRRPISIYESGVAQSKVFNARIDAINAAKKKNETLSAKDRLQNAKDLEASTWAKKVAKEKQLANAKALYQERLAFFKTSGSDGGTAITSTEQDYLNSIQTNINSLNNELVVLKKNYSDAVNTRKTLEKGTTDHFYSGKKSKIDKSNKNDNSTGQIEGASYNPPVTYNYNAPMVSAAYLNPGLNGNNLSPQQRSSYFPISSPAVATDGRLSWSDTTQVSKGIIQMSLDFLSLSYSANKDNNTYDDKLYGFRFLYNPKDVSMTWGAASGVNPEVIQAGQDKSSFVGLGLAESTVSFSLLLNRTLDMQYIDSNGLKSGVKNPYPYIVDDSELQEIYRRGTMYDMEYLFKTINGVNSTYKSSLNKTTADIGWLNGTAVELHLGEGLRYSVRIAGLDVNHTMFDSRMVPILSTVNIQCSRYYDNPLYDAATNSYKSPGGTTP